ncbi:MAG: cell division protein FtsZ, partial [Clostridia bacterium]
ISELINIRGLVNLDFADVTTVMSDAGYAHMGVGRASGKDKAVEAAKMAIASPLLETSITGAHGVIINITGSLDIGLEEVEIAAEMVRSAAHADANIIFGVAFDKELDDEIRVTVIATRFDSGKPQPGEGEKGDETVTDTDKADSKDEEDPYLIIMKMLEGRDK